MADKLLYSYLEGPYIIFYLNLPELLSCIDAVLTICHVQNRWRLREQVKSKLKRHFPAHHLNDWTQNLIPKIKSHQSKTKVPFTTLLPGVCLSIKQWLTCILLCLDCAINVKIPSTTSCTVTFTVWGVSTTKSKSRQPMSLLNICCRFFFFF